MVLRDGRPVGQTNRWRSAASPSRWPFMADGHLIIILKHIIAGQSLSAGTVNKCGRTGERDRFLSSINLHGQITVGDDRWVYHGDVSRMTDLCYPWRLSICRSLSILAIVDSALTKHLHRRPTPADWRKYRYSMSLRIVDLPRPDVGVSRCSADAGGGGWRRRPMAGRAGIASVDVGGTRKDGNVQRRADDLTSAELTCSCCTYMGMLSSRRSVDLSIVGDCRFFVLEAGRVGGRAEFYLI